MKTIKRGELRIEAGAAVLVEGDASQYLYTVLEGWAFRHKETENGARQIMNFVLPGDLLGLQTAVMGNTDHSATALTPLRLCIFKRNDIWKIFRRHPELSFDLTWLASREERILDRNLLSLGRRSGEQRVAYLVAQLADRAAITGLGARHKIKAPLRQHHFADALGMTKVHVSRMVSKLKARNLINWSADELEIRNWAGLCKFADYEPVEPRRLRPFI